MLAVHGLEAPAYGQDSGAEPVAIPCSDTGVTKHHDGVLSDGGFASCEWGFTDFTFGGVTLHWEDPVCPLYLLWTPPHDETGTKKGFELNPPTPAHAVMIFFVCDQEREACRFDGTLILPGHYNTYTDRACGVTPPGPKIDSNG
ncbi:MAG: hypothetical protein EYC70_10755 [Planctomycetota bacterium]|nr:MAG: hypothetical protein EYC70_10755 [Planctomycetota bacterium]